MDIGDNRPPGSWLRRVFLALLFTAFGATIGVTSMWPESKDLEAGNASAKLYQCPMHPAITADHPSNCPICGMKLVEVKAAPPTAERKVRFYRSPMDPTRTSPTPAKDEMGMDFLPVYQDEPEASKSVPGLASIVIDPERQQLIGLRTARVARGPISEVWRTVGRVQVDPTRVRRINTKVEGFVERLFVDFVGRPVRRGERLFSVYSPTLFAAETELVVALETRDRLPQGSFGDRGADLVSAARTKLELWDVPSEEIERLVRTRQPSKTVTFLSPIAGVVTAKSVAEGARIGPADAVYEITDLSAVWVMADAYETDLARVRIGMAASLTLEARPGSVYRGRVEFIDPFLDAKSRTTKVHLHFPNSDGALLPEMFGEVTLEGALREGLRIPRDAVLRSGAKDVVFVSLGNGKLQPREVSLGVRAGDQVEVTAGLEEGQEVVTRANFLVDSESQLRASLAAIGGE
ncbi:MAG: efflux RND transporter periplasmic adaptor subunit [Deltaproteobacteria bacterium]|nr:efflux RND transporter periplasmic adaptor subunit [Deltaproteobacteria bacterium]